MYSWQYQQPSWFVVFILFDFRKCSSLMADSDVKETRLTSSFQKFHGTRVPNRSNGRGDDLILLSDQSANTNCLFSCPDRRLRVAPKIKFMLGIGHKMTEGFFVFRYAMTRWYCFCFDTHHFGNDMDLHHLLLEPVFPDCETMLPHRTLEHTTVKDLENKTSH